MDLRVGFTQSFLDIGDQICRRNSKRWMFPLGLLNHCWRTAMHHWLFFSLSGLRVHNSFCAVSHSFRSSSNKAASKQASNNGYVWESHSHEAPFVVGRVSLLGHRIVIVFRRSSWWKQVVARPPSGTNCSRRPADQGESVSVMNLF